MSVTGYSRAFGYAICSVLDHMASSIEKLTKPSLPSGKLGEKGKNPSHLIHIHITACFPDDSLVSYTRQFLNSHRLTYSPTMALPPHPTPPPHPLPLTHATPTWAFSGTDLSCCFSQVQMKTPNPQKQVS